MNVKKDNIAVVLGMFETGLAVGRSLGRAGIKVLGLDSVRKIGLYSKYIEARICPDPLRNEEEFLSFLLRIAEKEKFPPVLFITSDEFLLPISRNRDRLERHYLMNLPTPHIIECIADKYKQHSLALEAGIPVPRTFVANSMEELQKIADQIPFPAFCKGAEVTLWRSKMGVASKGFVVSNREELLDTFKMIFEKGANGLIQEIIPGPDTNHYKLSCYLSRNGEVLLAFGLQKIRQQPVGFGFGCLVQSIKYPEMLDLGKEFFTKIGYRGVGSAEFKLDHRDGRLKLIELNPRYWQQNGLSDRCGMNFPLMNYLELTGDEPKAMLEYRSGIKWVNIYSDIESFREYRQRGQISWRQWLASFRGEIMFSDLEWDDIRPGLRELLFDNILRRSGRYVMKRLKYAMIFLLAIFMLLASCGAGGGAMNGITPGVAIVNGTEKHVIAPPTTVTVRPIEISDVLYNPGMGIADFHFGAGWGKPPPPPEEYPPQTVAYFRWTWDQLEPSEGRYNFELVDNVIRKAKAKGETLAFRIVSVYKGSTPKWLLDKGVDSIAVGRDIFPDHNNPVFLEYHRRLVKAFGDRYAGTPDIDHVDIGSVGCWGEWNTACCKGVEALCNQYFPTDSNKLLITDWYFQYFPGTPLVMLQGGPIEYAASKGAGWRGDCFGDYGMFSPTWNHMVNVYEPTARNPVVGEAWKTGPVQFEACGVMQNWYDRGYDIDLILKKGLDWHMTVFNAKSSPVPAAWRSKVDEFLKRVGYRFVLREMTHSAEVSPGGLFTVRSLWENKGVAPIYHPWLLAYRLRSNTDKVVATWKSTANLMNWLPGTHEVEEVVAVPGDVPAGTYNLDIAILSEDGKTAHVELAIAGKRPDKWYPVSEVTIKTLLLPHSHQDLQ